MHFSTSATPATVIFLAGQTLARCSHGFIKNPPDLSDAGPCGLIPMQNPVEEPNAMYNCGRSYTTISSFHELIAMQAMRIDSTTVKITCGGCDNFFHCLEKDSYEFSNPCTGVANKDITVHSILEH